MTDETQPESNKPQRRLKSKLDKTFGISDNPADHGFGPRPDADKTNDKRSFGDRDHKPSYGSRDGARPSFGDRDRRPSYGSRDGARPSFGDRDRRPSYGSRDGARPSFGDRDRRPSYGSRDGARPSFGDRDRRPSYGSRDGARPSFGDRDRRPSYGSRDGGARPSFGEEDYPIYRKKPEEEKELSTDTIKDEAALENANLEAVNSTDLEQNPPWFKRLLALTTEKGREREGLFLAEGIHVVQELLDNHIDLIKNIYIEENFENDVILAKIKDNDITLHTMPPEQMKRLSTTVTTQGIIAIARIASQKPDYLRSRSILTLVDAVQDPGNLGTLFRTSLGFGATGMVLGKGTVNPFNPKVVRGSSGTFLRVPFEKEIDMIDEINYLRQQGYTIIATDLHAKQSLSDIAPNKLKKVAILVGNEGAGTNRYLIDIADETVIIPMSNQLESLNVSVAHGILTYELARLQKAL